MFSVDSGYVAESRIYHEPKIKLISALTTENKSEHICLYRYLSQPSDIQTAVGCEAGDHLDLLEYIHKTFHNLRLASQHQMKAEVTLFKGMYHN